MKYYKYAGNPSCGCCDDPCPSIRISRCNFDEYCITSGEEWIEHDYGTQAKPDKQCELWYRQSATISIDSTKTGAVDNAVWIKGFGAGAWDDKYRGSSQTRADGDTFVITETVTLGNHTIVYSHAHEWVYNSSSTTYSDILKIGVYIDGNCYWTDELEYRGSTSVEPSYTFNLVLYRRGNYVDVYTSNGAIWVWSFYDSSSNRFAYTFQAVYTGSTKYIHVNPNLTWETVKYKPDPGCVYYPPGTLTQAEIDDIEERQRLSYEDNVDCNYTSGIFCPVFSPRYNIVLNSLPSAYSACPTTYSPIYITNWIGMQHYANPVWKIRKSPFCMDSTEAHRVSLSIDYAAGTRAKNNCSEFPYGYTIDYWRDATDQRVLTIVTQPQYGEATVINETDGNNQPTISKIRYTAPEELPEGVCVDWLEYQLEGRLSVSRGVLKFKLYSEDYEQSETWEESLDYPSRGTVEDSDYYQEVLRLNVTGERYEIGSTAWENQWSVYLYGACPPMATKLSDLNGVRFSYIEGVSHWGYQCDDIDDINDHVSDEYPLQPGDYYYQCYIDAKNALEAMTAQIVIGRERASKFVAGYNNIFDSCSTQQIDSTETVVSMKLVKSRKYNDGSVEELDSQQLPNQTVVVDWGVSPTESPLGLKIIYDWWFTVDVSQYSSRFYVNSFTAFLYFFMGGIIELVPPGRVWSGNSGNTGSMGYYDEVTVEAQIVSNSINYF